MFIAITLFVGGVAMADISDTVQKFNPQLKGQLLSEVVDSIYRFGVAYGLEPRLIAAVIATESSFNLMARGKAKEVGLMQLHPKYHLASTNPMKNIGEGVKYLAAIRDIYYRHYGDTRWVEHYNRGPFSKRPLKFPYTKRVLQNYAIFNGGESGQERPAGSLQQTKEWGSKHRRGVSQTPSNYTYELIFTPKQKNLPTKKRRAKKSKI